MECRIGEEDEGLIQRSCHVTIVTQLMSFQRERERERERACAQPVHSPPPPRHACRGSPFMPLHPTSHKHAQEEAEDESKLYSFLVFFF